jgi:glycosyltransferase involved in cell wall biosynthesis
MGLNPALHLAIAWIEGLMAASRSSFVKEVKRISSLGGTGTPTLTTDNPADRVEVLFALATDSRSLAVADDIAAARVRLWKARSSIISANYIGVIHAPPPLPDLAAVAIDEELNRRDESSLDVLSRWFGQQETRGGARNIFGEEPPSRLMSGIRPGMAPPACVYFLRGEGEASAAIASMLERQWPTGLLPLTPIEWNSNTRQLEVRSTAAADGIRIGDGPPACLLIAGPLGDDEPLGLVGAISEARSRGWTVLAIVDSSSTAVTLQSPHDPQATRIALYWQSLVLADRVIATSNVAERQLREFLASEVGDDDASLVTTIPFLPGLGAQREVQEAAFAHQLATAVSTLGRGPDEFVGTIFYHSGMAAAALRGPPLAGLLSSLGVSVREMSKVSPVVPFPSSERPSWVIADFETDVSELRKLRSTAARLAAKTAYLGPVPVARRGLMEELLNWDLVATSRFEDFTAVSEYLKTTRLRMVDAESRFVFLDHPSEQSAGALQDGSIGAKPSGASFTVGVTLQSNPEGQTRLQKEFRSDSRERGTKSNPSVHAVDLSDLDKTDSQADLDKLIDEAAQLDLLIVDGTAGHVLDIVERVTARGTPCLVDSALTLPRLQGVLQVPFDRVENILSFVAANVDFFRAELRTAVAMRRGPGASERAGRLLELLATQSAPCVAAAGEKHSQFINQCPGQPLLSLCISTYNRAGWVAMNLDNIFRQIADLDHNIEILLVDNCSTDNTEEVASRFMSHRRFRYVRNTRNVGMLGNLSVTAQLSRGKFVWIIGDDDFTRPGTVARLCDLLENQSKYDLVCFNYGYVSYKDPSEVEDATGVTENFNQLEPPGPDRSGLVGELAPMSENFYTAIYSHVYRRRYAIRAYCQNTLGRPFSSLLTCVPTSAFTLSQMGHLNAYWFGEPALVINSNVSWQQYGTLFDLEQLPRVWDLAERAGAASTEVDRRRSNRLWLVEMMWRDMYANNDVGNQGFFDPERVLMRIKHLNATDELVPRLREIYEDAHRRNEPAARKPANQIFVAWGPEFGSASEAKAS